MIAVSSSSRSFAALGRYLVVGRDKVEEGRVAWTSARNLPTDEPELAAKIMRATASQNVRVSQPVYHVVLSFDPGDAVDRASMERVADRVLKELKLDQYQAIIVAHADRAHPHLHILVNRIHPETGRAWDRWHDYPAIQRVLREEESELNLRPVRASVDVAPNTARAVESASVAQREGVISTTTSRSRTSSIERQFDELDSAKEAAEQRFSAEREVAAAEARREQVETAIVRQEQARRPFESALRRAYVDPRAAGEAFRQLAEREGERIAVARMRENPEAFGQLIGARESGGVWRRNAVDHSAAREAAREAAGYGANVIAARRDLKHLTSSERQDAAFRGSLAPTAESVRAQVNAQLDAARFRLSALRSSHEGKATREQVELRLGQALRRLAPPEFQRLRSTLSMERFSIASKLRRMARDAVLGRDADE